MTLPRAPQIALCLAALALSGCQSISGNTAQVRVIVTSPNAPGMDLNANGMPLAYNLGFGNVTSYIPLGRGTYMLSATSTGSRQVLTTASTTLDGSAQYTILLGDTTANLQQATLRDQNTAAPPGQVALRFLDQATATGPVDVYLVSPGSSAVTPLLAGQSFGGNSGYLNLPAGAYRIVLSPAGSAPTVPLHTEPLVTYPAGAARTILLLDHQPGTAVQVIAASDFEPSN